MSDEQPNLYCRVISSDQARTLIWMVKKFEADGQYIHVNREAPPWALRHREWHRLRLWGLIEAEPDGKGKRNGGRYRPTVNGIEFAHGRLVVWKKVWERGGKVVKRSENDLVWIQDRLSAPFIFEALWEKPVEIREDADDSRGTEEAA